MKNTIFVMIPSYRDTALLNTIASCLDNAKYPMNLRFGICHQFDPNDEWDTLVKYEEDSRFSIISILSKNSKGASWARNKAQRLYSGEKYLLMIDAHMLFDKHWDEFLIKELKATNSKKPILTAYVNNYTSSDGVRQGGVNDATILAPRYFTTISTIRFQPQPVDTIKYKNKPTPGMFISGHFMFTLGIHCTEFLHDQRVPYYGDESRMSIISYTLGYDIFHPHKNVLWHEYAPQGRDTHKILDENNNIVPATPIWDEISLMLIRSLFGIVSNRIAPLGAYGLGTSRTLADYEEYCGVNFKDAIFHVDALQGQTPPMRIKPKYNHYEDKNVLILYSTMDLTMKDNNMRLFDKYTNAGYVVIRIMEPDILRVNIQNLYPKKCVLLNIHPVLVNKIKKDNSSIPIVIEQYSGDDENIVNPETVSIKQDGANL